MMIGGVLLMSRDPRALAEWYARHLGWQLEHLTDEDPFYIELYYRDDDRSDRRLPWLGAGTCGVYLFRSRR